MARDIVTTCLVSLCLASVAPFFSTTEAAETVPTSIAQSVAEKREVREQRQAYFDEIHRTPPGIDWREIERENRHAAFLKRQADLAGGRGTTAWTELGSANQAGRTHTTAYSPQTGALYIGSALGGVWKGDVSGSSWAPISDGLGIGGHRLVVSHGVPEVLTVGSGSAMYVSADDGGSWSVPVGIPEMINSIKRIVVDESVPNRVFALIRGQRWLNDAWEYGHFIVRSDDGGLTYETVYTDVYTGAFDLWIDRVAGGTLYLVKNANVSRSVDGGVSFTLMGTIPVNVTDIVLTASEAGAPTVYAATNSAAGWELWRSLDAGASWSRTVAMTDWWGSAFCASITNPNLVLYGGVECWRSANGGQFFSKVNNWWDYYGDPANRLHADFPGRIECRMVGDQETFFLNTDGGTYTSIDGVASVQNISLDGLGVSQYYTVFTSETDPYLVVAGAQDQGYQQSDPTTNPYLEFDQLISGDYAQATSTVRNHDWLYTVYPGFILVQTNESEPQQLLQRDFPSGANHLWLPPLHAHPSVPTTVYLGADHMWEYRRETNGAWTQTQLPQDFTVAGGLYISAIGIAPSDPDVWYVAVNNGRMWYSHDGGGSWNASGDILSGHYFHGHGFTVSPTDPMRAYVSGSGYNGPGVYETIDGGVSWIPMGDGLPPTMVFEVALDNAADLTLYAATEAGPHRYLDAAGMWVSILGTEAPLTTYWDVESVPELGVMRFGTYGRGIWDFDPDGVVGVASDAPFEPAFVAAVAPSPARSSATVSFALERAGHVAVEVFDLSGRRVLEPLAETLDAGDHAISFALATAAGRHLETGVYFVRVSSPLASAVEKLQVVR